MTSPPILQPLSRTVQLLKHTIAGQQFQRTIELNHYPNIHTAILSESMIVSSYYPSALQPPTFNTVGKTLTLCATTIMLAIPKLFPYNLLHQSVRFPIYVLRHCRPSWQGVSAYEVEEDRPAEAVDPRPTKVQCSTVQVPHGDPRCQMSLSVSIKSACLHGKSLITIPVLNQEHYKQTIKDV